MERYREFLTDFSEPSFRFAASPAQYAAWRDGLAALSGDKSLQAVMSAMAAVLSDPAARGNVPAGVLQNALDWLESLRQRLEQANRAYGAVHMLETSAVMADSDGEPVPGTERPEVFVWNERSISDTEAMDAIKAGMGEFSDKVVRLSPAQAALLFPDRAELEENDEEDSKNG